jgi:hypothetical protein
MQFLFGPYNFESAVYTLFPNCGILESKISKPNEKNNWQG